jgi:hypothetical protein
MLIDALLRAAFCNDFSCVGWNSTMDHCKISCTSTSHSNFIIIVCCVLTLDGGGICLSIDNLRNNELLICSVTKVRLICMLTTRAHPLCCWIGSPFKKVLRELAKWNADSCLQFTVNSYRSLSSTSCEKATQKIALHLVDERPATTAETSRIFG